MHPTSTRRRIAALAVAAATTMTVLTVTPQARAQTPPGQLRTGENYRLGNPPAARVRDIPGLAVNPANTNQIVQVERDVLTLACNSNVSSDGGVTWQGGPLFAPGGFPGPDAQVVPTPHCPSFEGSVEWGSAQNVYAAFASARATGHGNSAIVSRSTDGGRTFVPVVAMNNPNGVAPNPSYSNPELAVVAGGGTGGADRLYLAANNGNRIVVNFSLDGGLTWSAPVVVDGTPANCCTEASAPAVGPDGSVYVAYRTNVFEGLVRVAKNTNPTGGGPWTQTDAAPVRGYIDENGSIAGSTSTWPRIATSKVGNEVYIVYGQGPPINARDDHFIHADLDALFVKSTNGGATWSAPIRVNDDPLGSGTPAVGPAQRHPDLVVAPNGRIDVVWQDRRHAYRAPTHSHLGNGEARMGDTYYAYSVDGGNTFSKNRRITDKTQNLDVGYDHYGQIYWSWGPEVANLGTDQLLFAWQDSREGNYDNENDDIYLAKLNLQASDTIPVQRLPEGTRSGLSITLSQWAYQGGSQAILGQNFGNQLETRLVVVNEGDDAGALAASVLSRAYLGSLLVSPAGGLTNQLKAEVRRMSPTDGAYVIGGESALSAQVVRDLTDAGVPPTGIRRLSGNSAAETAKAIAQAMDKRDGGLGAAALPMDAAVIVNPASKEAATAAGMAASLRLPILFTETDSVPAATREALSGLAITNTLVVGGSGVVSDAVVASLPGAKRLGGADVAAVSRSVVAESVARRLPTNIVYVTDANQTMDSALVGAAVARVGGLHLVVPGADTDQANQSLGQLGLRSGVDRLIVARSLGGPGYRLVASDGGIFAFGGSGFFGSTGAMRLAQPMVGMANTRTNNGYWTVAADGGIFAFGDARFFGSTGALRLAEPVVGMAATPTGNGYWLVARDGGVFAFGDARFRGSTGGMRLNQPIVGMAATPSGNGYWLVAADGGIFAFGDAVFRGSTGAMRLNQPIVGMASTPSGNGYWLVARDGGIFAFGDAAFHGSTGAIRLAQPVVGMDSTPSGRGYHLVASDGGVFAFGDAVFSGSMGGTRLARPVVGIASAN